jgi:hypothetical protein
MLENRYVFLSYSRLDQKVAEQLTADLNRRGIQVWRDVEQIAPGSRWAEEVEKGLSQASALLYLSSKHSRTSAWMQKEVQFFLASPKLVLPIIVDEEGANSMPVFLQTRQCIDLAHGYDRALDRIIEAITSTIPVGPPVSPQARQSKGYVFLSYVEEDADFVEALKVFLKKHKYAYWDYEESDRDYHGQLFLELEGVISEASATLSVLTEAWKRSKWTAREYFYSEEIGRPVFLLRAKEMSPTLAVAGVPYIDFVASMDKGFEKLHRELQRKGL